MRRTLAVALFLVGCGGGADAGSGAMTTSPVGDWIDIASDTSAIAYSFRADRTYSAARISATSVTASGGSADVELETGTYVDGGSTIHFVPKTFTCQRAVGVYDGSYSFSAGVLVLSFSNGTVTLAPNNAPVTANVTLVYGCFSGATFTAGPTYPTGN